MSPASMWHAGLKQRIRMSYKPVKPVQNETFEYVDPDGKFKLLVEEVRQIPKTKISQCSE